MYVANFNLVLGDDLTHLNAQSNKMIYVIKNWIVLALYF